MMAHSKVVGGRTGPLPESPPTSWPSRHRRLKGWVYCSVCGEGRHLRGKEKRLTGMCVTCLRANMPTSTEPHLCLLCGETEPSKFAIKSRKRCTACINAKHRREAAELRARLTAYFKTLPQCWVCGLKDSHVVDELRALCVVETELLCLAAVVVEQAAA